MLWLWATYLLATTVYLLPPGMPQLADGVMALMILVVATGYFVRAILPRDLVLCAAPFLAYAILVNLAWYGLDGDRRFALSAAYYVYNFAAVLMVVSLVAACGWERTATWTRAALLTALTVELVAVYTLQSTAHVEDGVIVRNLGTFSNPNKMGYWALCAGACWLAASVDRKMTVLDLAALGLVMALVIASLSKAAMLGGMVLVLAALWFQQKSLKLRVTAAVVGLAGLIALAPLAGGLFEQIAATQAATRLSDIGGQSDDSLGGRGYDRFWLYPEHLLLGAGEGAYDRFAKSGAVGLEMHSTFGTVLYSYGIPGAFLFGVMVLALFRRARLEHLAYATPLVLYGITHQGLRSTMLWVFCGLVFSHGWRRTKHPAHCLHATLSSISALSQPLNHLSTRRGQFL